MNLKMQWLLSCEKDCRHSNFTKKKKGKSSEINKSQKLKHTVQYIMLNIIQYISWGISVSDSLSHLRRAGRSNNQMA